MSEREQDAPTCRTCYAQTLSKYERARFWDEPVTGCVYYCPEHQAVQDQIMASVDWSKVIKARLTPPAVDQDGGRDERAQCRGRCCPRPNDRGPMDRHFTGGVCRPRRKAVKS